jgi:subtilisin family serine protease
MLLLAAAALADDSFFLGEGPERTSLSALIAEGGVRGRTGALVGQLRPNVDLPALPEIVAVDRLPGGVVRLHLAPGTDDVSLSRTLHDRAELAWVHPDLLLNLVPHRIPDDPQFPDQWHHDNTGQGGRTGEVDLNSPAAWDLATGAGVLIAVLDSGVQLDHPDLVVTGGSDFVDHDDASPGTDSSAPHGTGVAGIAAARGNNGIGAAGAAWEADIYAIRLIGGSTSTSDLYDAFAEAVDAGAGVLNNSWGFGGCGENSDSAIFSTMLNYAERKGRGGLGSVVVFSAGNDSCDNSGDPLLSKETPVVVGALEWTDERASYSNWGDEISIAAPTSLLTTDITPGGYGSYEGDDAYYDGFSGTSASAPVVSGVVALMLEANPRATAEQVRDVLCQTAVRNDLAGAEWDEDGWSPYYGCGRVDAAAAVATIADSPPGAPTARLTSNTVYADRIVLAWTPADDPDGDVFGYAVEWWRSDKADRPQNLAVSTLTADLTGLVSAGHEVSWRVAGTDPWGAGAWSDTSTFTIVDAPLEEEAPPDEEAPDPEPAGCGIPGAGHGARAALGGAVFALAARRRAWR